MSDWNRRHFLGVSAGALIGANQAGPASAQGQEWRRGLPLRPDLLVILTDQERHPVHWPRGLRDELMPSWSRLERTGLTFRRAYCSASECSPSRACLVTGQYADINGVPHLSSAGMPSLRSLPNIASVLGGAGYDVYWKGKWHLSFPEGFKGGPPSNEVWTEADVAALRSRYGMQGWNPPDAGNAAGAYTPSAAEDAKARALMLATAGGGLANNDDRYVAGIGTGREEGVLALLARLATTPRQTRRPFALFVSLVNPHDITFFPNGWQAAGYGAADLAASTVELPSNAADDLSTKPSIQARFRDALDARTPLQGGEETPLTYVRFYARLHATVEPHIQALLDALSRYDLARDTVIIRTADHGELGMSHGLREKAYTAYEEMIHVPLVISNPTLFPEPVATNALYSHVDLLPTLAELAGVPPIGVGTSMVPVVRDPTWRTQDSVLFAFDDSFLLTDGPGSHIRAIRDERWTYAVYYGATGGKFEYELYDNVADPGQMRNLAHRATAEAQSQWRRLHQELVAKMDHARATPSGFAFPSSPT